MMNKIDEIMKALKEPFPPGEIKFKPQATKGDRCMAIAYGDLRAYQNRLDAVAGSDWSVTYSPWGDKIICHITLCGVTRSSVGEPDAQSERSEIDGTAAEAQAFKRACAMFGLGRYLYNLPQTWVAFDANSKKIAPDGEAKLKGMIAQHYSRFLAEKAKSAQVDADEIEIVDSAAPLFSDDPPVPTMHFDVKDGAQLQQTVEQIHNGDEPNPFTDPKVGHTAAKETELEALKAKAEYWRQLDADSEKVCSDNQYNLFVRVVEDICGKKSHSVAFHAMFKKPYTSDNRPGNKAVGWLLDVLPAEKPERDATNGIVRDANGKVVLLPNEKHDPVALAAVKHLYEKTVAASPK